MNLFSILSESLLSHLSHVLHCQGVPRRMISVVNFFIFLKTKFFVVATFDLVHDVEAIFHLL